MKALKALKLHHEQHHHTSHLHNLHDGEAELATGIIDQYVPCTFMSHHICWGVCSPARRERLARETRESAGETGMASSTRTSTPPAAIAPASCWLTQFLVATFPGDEKLPVMANTQCNTQRSHTFQIHLVWFQGPNPPLVWESDYDWPRLQCTSGNMCKSS